MTAIGTGRNWSIRLGGDGCSAVSDLSALQKGHSGRGRVAGVRRVTGLVETVLQVSHIRTPISNVY